MIITIINDCRDANAAGRQITRASSLMNGNVSFMGISNDLEAAGNLIDVLDAYDDNEGVILVNVAPRHGKAKKWKNGTPFGYFWYNKILVVASIDGYTLSMVKKLKLVDHINVLDIPTVIELFVSQKIISAEVGNHIIDTQFRSFDFVPRVAAYLVQKEEVISEKMSINEIADAPSGIWWIDNFGNCKTTILKEEVSQDQHIKTAFGLIPYFERLKDVPDKETAVIIGSSGLPGKRFLELVVQGESAAAKFNLKTGDSIL